MLPINIRYGPTGLLGQAAFDAGQGQQNQSDLGLVMRDLMSRRQLGAQQDQQASEQSIDANRLQEAQALQTQRLQGSATSQNYFRGNGSPLTVSLLAKQRTRQAMLGGAPLSDDDTNLLDQAQQDPNTNPQSYANLVKEVSQRQTLAQKAEAQQSTSATRQAQQQQIEADKNANATRHDLAGPMKQLHDEIVAGGGDPEGPPDQWNGTTAPNTRGGLLDSLSDMAVQGGTDGLLTGRASESNGLTTGADPDMLAKYVKYKQLQQQSQQHRPGTRPAVAAAPVGTATVSIPHVATSEDYAAVPPGGKYIGPDGHMRVKPQATNGVTNAESVGQ